MLFFLYKGVKEYYFVKSVLCIEVDTGLLVFLSFFGIWRPFLNISKKKEAHILLRIASLRKFYSFLFKQSYTHHICEGFSSIKID